jgi:hypothetical protein
MRAVAILAGVVALAVPTAASAGAPAGAARTSVPAASGLFASVAAGVCRERQLRPFDRSAEATAWARRGNLRCVQRMLGRERLFARGLTTCTEQLTGGLGLDRRLLSQCVIDRFLVELGIES